MITVFSFNVITKSDDIIYMLNWTRSEASSFHTHIFKLQNRCKKCYTFARHTIALCGKDKTFLRLLNAAQFRNKLCRAVREQTVFVTHIKKCIKN